MTESSSSDPNNKEISMETEEIEDTEIARKNLVNRQSFPIATNIEIWNSLRKYRFFMMKDKTIDILEKWPLYGHSDSACLISDDFSAKFPNIKCKLAHYWDKIRKELVDIYKRDLIDPGHKTLIDDYAAASNLDEEAKTVFLFYMLPTLLKPTGRPQRSVADAQNCFISYFKAAKDINECKTPRVLIIGSSVLNIDQISLNYRGRNIRCSNMLEAVELCFKYFWIIDTPYPDAAKNVYIFLQKFFYGIEVSGIDPSPDVNKLISALEQFVSNDTDQISVAQ